MGGVRRRPSRDLRHRRPAARVLHRAAVMTAAYAVVVACATRIRLRLDRRGRPRPARRLPPGAADALDGRLQLRGRRPAGRALPPRPVSRAPRGEAPRRRLRVRALAPRGHRLRAAVHARRPSARSSQRGGGAVGVQAGSRRSPAWAARRWSAGSPTGVVARRRGPSPHSASTRCCWCGRWRGAQRPADAARAARRGGAGPAGDRPAAGRGARRRGRHQAQRGPGDPVLGRCVARRDGCGCSPASRSPPLSSWRSRSWRSRTTRWGCSPSSSARGRWSTSPACRSASPTRSGCPASSRGRCRSCMLLLAIWTAGWLVYVARGGDALAAAGWALLGVIVASSWLLPWYLVWPLASPPPRTAGGCCWPPARSAPPTRSATRRWHDG